MKKKLIKKDKVGLYNASELTGDASGLTGNVKDCELSKQDRNRGIQIELLVCDD